MAPTASQTSNSHIGDPNALAMPAGVRKMPTAMHSPATRAVAEARPSSRRSSDFGTDGMAVAVVIFDLEGPVAGCTGEDARASIAFELYLNRPMGCSSVFEVLPAPLGLSSL